MPDPVLTARFRDHLRDLGLKPGDLLEGEIALAQRFGVSRGALREVIMHFCQLGVLERVRNRGTSVRALDPEMLASDLATCFALAGFDPADLKETRRLVETGAAALVARRLAPAAAADLQRLIAAMAGEPDLAAADRLDRDFHLRLIAACGNPCLSMFAGVIQALFHQQHRQQFLNRAAVEHSLADHRAILAALEAGDGAAAARLLDAHIAAT
ncbi:MAG: FCD domain-containing protein [Planctomycetes bacterium]|nr:FCD domain-containing protein [Planctomycetota bacterium]